MTTTDEIRLESDPRRCGWMADREGDSACGMRGVFAVRVEVTDPHRWHERRRMLLFLCAKHNFPAMTS